MNRHTMAGALLAILFLAACSSEPQKAAQKSEPAKPQPKPTETLTGREVFQKLYPAARGWAGDAKPVRFESSSTSDADGHGGKVAVWRVLFASPARGKMETFSWSGSSTADASERGVSHGVEDTFSLGNALTRPFDLNFLKVDSDAAFETAQKHGGDKVLKQEAKVPVQYLLSWDPGKNQLVWRVIYGNSRNDAKLIVNVDATTGTFLRIEK